MPTSNVTLTPVYVDYSNGSAWSSLGGNQTAYQNAVGQVFTDLGNALYFSGGAKQFKYQVGLNAYGANAADTAGNALSGGAVAQSNQYIADLTPYANYRSALVALSKNSLQQTAFNITNLPVSNPVSDTTFTTAALLQESIALQSFSTGVIAGGLGFNPSFFTDTNQHGLGAGLNVYCGVFHELTEIAGRVENSELWWWGSAGVRQTDGTQAHYLSYDQGSTASKIYDLGLSGAGDDFDTINLQTAFNQSAVSGAVCRDASTPGFAKDWQYMTTFGFVLSDLGLSWAGLTGTTYGFSPGLKR